MDEIDPLTNLKQTFDYEKFNSDKKSKKILSRIGGQQGVLNENGPKELGITGLGSLIGIQGGVGVYDDNDNDNKDLEDFVLDHNRRYKNKDINQKVRANHQFLAQFQTKVDAHYEKIAYRNQFREAADFLGNGHEQSLRL